MVDLLLSVDSTHQIDLVARRGSFDRVPLSDDGIDVNTKLQRASLAAYIAQGSIPGLPQTGTNFAAYLAKEATLVDVDNSVKQHIDGLVGAETLDATITPFLLPAEQGMYVGLIVPDTVEVVQK